MIFPILENHLYISNRINAIAAIETGEIPSQLSVITIESQPLPQEISSSLTNYLFLNYNDEPESHLIKDFDEINIFFKQNKPILIHCLEGQSRSVAAVLAILMKTTSKSLSESISFLNSKSIKTENMIDAFTEQLLLYQAMNCNLNTSSIEYRLWRFSQLSESNLDSMKAWSSIADTSKANMVYRCSDCRYKLFKDSHINTGFSKVKI